WEGSLVECELVGGDEADKAMLYTSLFRTVVAAFLYQDVDGKYRGMDGKVHQAEDGLVNYSVYSMWDTFRAAHPLKTIIDPERAEEFANDLIRKYEDGGILPKWELHSHYTGTMIGFPAVSIIADAMAKGLDIDPQLAKEAAEFTVRYHEASEFPDWTEDNNIGAANVVQVKVYEENGFVHHGYWNSASYTLEFAYGDWAMA
ncbi:glycoside hydrolase family 92 protein, partial [Vibrio parahaemolyticus]|nr:glycoside hydrolase family 92 protein [Vibrio parahaemolyticus]